VTNPPLPPGRPASPATGSHHGSKRRGALALLLGAAAAVCVAVPAFADPSVSSKQAEAQSVLGQIQQLDASLEHAIEAYNAATIKLNKIRGDLKQNARELVIARKTLVRAQSTLSRRLVEMYTSGSDDSTLAVLFGATSLDNMLDRLDTVDRVSSQDAGVLKQVIASREEIQARRLRLKRAKAEQAEVVAERAAAKASVQRQLGQRRALLSSIHGEIARLQAAERARQAALERRVQAQISTEHSTAQVLAETVAGPVAGGGSGSSAGGGSSAAPVPAPPPSRAGGVVGIAMQYLGTPYRWGGAAPGGFDCSGFVMYVFAQVGISLPHNAAAQYGYGSPVSRDQLAPGDIVFFNGLGHNGIYVGGGSFIHSPHTGDVVKISSMSGWYASTYVGARRM
jgi:peptidoglycan DL-endopeptidase CwlO